MLQRQTLRSKTPRPHSRRIGVIAWLRRAEGSAILEFSITIPLLVVFVVGIYDFSGAFNQKQKIEQAAQEGAIVAGGQQTTDINSSNPDSLLAVVTAVFNSLAGSGVIPTGACPRPWPVANSGLTWTYTIGGCNGSYPSDNLVITINRGCVCGSCGAACAAGAPVTVGTNITVTYPYHWRFNSVIQLLIPGASYQATTYLTESATVHNQM
jgi:Flp pilus assembly protein TadG